MAKFEKGSFTVDSTGESSLKVLEDDTLTPNFFEFKIGGRPATNETHVIYSSGWQDLNLDRKVCVSNYDDGTVRGSRRSSTESFAHYKNVTSTLTKVIGGYISYTEAGGFKYTASVADDDYVVDYVAWEI